MVIYQLECVLGHQFEGWFPNSSTFNEQKQQSMISCSVCGSLDIEKIPSGGHVSGVKSQPQVISQSKSLNTDKITNLDPVVLLKSFHQFLEKTCKNVGKEFTEKAIKIHKGEMAAEPIYGEASDKDRERLQEEGVPYSVVPKLDEQFEN